MLALRKEPQLKYSLLPVWWDSKQLSQAAFDVRDKAMQELKKREEIARAKKDQEALEEQRKRNRESEKTEIERRLRVQNGAKARALMNEIVDFVKKVAEKRSTDTEHFLPDYSNWLAIRFAEGWETFNVRYDVFDYGIAQWEHRSLDAVIVKVVIQQKNRMLGKYDDRCYVVGMVDDAEFQMERDQFAVECGDIRFVNSWRVGKDFHSGWNAN